MCITLCLSIVMYRHTQNNRVIMYLTGFEPTTLLIAWTLIRLILSGVGWLKLVRGMRQEMCIILKQNKNVLWLNSQLTLHVGVNPS